MLDGGELDVVTLKAEAKKAGMGWRTVQRAKTDLKVRSEKSKYTGGWMWRMPKDGAAAAPAAEEGDGQCPF